MLPSSKIDLEIVAFLATVAGALGHTACVCDNSRMHLKLILDGPDYSKFSALVVSFLICGVKCGGQRTLDEWAQKMCTCE